MKPSCPRSSPVCAARRLEAPPPGASRGGADRLLLVGSLTQVFFEDYALHGAYWHDEWGDRRSAGCVNLAPIYAKWIFDWSEPTLPPDWHARRTLPGEPTTAVVVHD